MTASSAEDGVKRMMQAVLEKTRSEDAEVVLMALRCAHRIWSDLGIQVVMSLSEVVMYTSELQDHEDSRVETEVKAMVRTIEDSRVKAEVKAMVRNIEVAPPSHATKDLNYTSIFSIPKITHTTLELASE